MPNSRDSQLRVLDFKQRQPDLSKRQLADGLGFILVKANCVLRELLEMALIKERNFRNSPNKLSNTYLLSTLGIAQKAAVAQGYLQRKTAEYEALRSEIESLQREIGAQAANV